MIETLKEFKIQQQVTVMPISDMENEENSSRSELAQVMECLGLKFNNTKYNDPMFTGKQMASLIFFIFSMILAIIIFRDFVPIVDPHKAFVYQVIIIEPILLKILAPIAYLMIKQDFRKYFHKNIKISYYNSGAAGAAHTHGLGKTTIAVQCAVAAAAPPILLNPGTTEVLPVLPPTEPLINNCNFQSVQLHQNLDPKGLCPSNQKPETSK